MNDQLARTILTDLSEGRVPLTVEPLPPGSVCNRIEVVRALNRALRGFGRRTQDPSLPTNTGRRWTGEEEGRLEAAFTAGEDPKAIAKELGRTVGSIRSRLEHLGLLDESA
ncbi:MAG TPA: hypothetical protein QGF58_17010 [Myxococcota bacterium]|nr:hypothetical protein [Myxococcota bacterium]